MAVQVFTLWGVIKHQDGVDMAPDVQEQLEAEAIQMEGLFNSGDYVALEVLARSFVERHPLIGFGWSVLGTSLQLQGKDSLPALQKAADLLPQDALAQSNLGDALQSAGEYARAEASYAMALAIEPNSAETHLNLGNALKAQGQLERAETSYIQALTLRPDFAEAHYNLGITLKARGRLEEAEKNFRQAIQIQPNFGQAHVELGSTLVEAGQLTGAEAIFRAAVQLIPTLAEAHANLGATLKTLGRPLEAEASFRQAIHLNPELAEAHSNLGAILFGMARASEAEASFRHALTINPDFAEAHNGLAAALRSLSRPEDAVASCRTALRINPKLAEAHNNLGALLSDLGQFEEAELSYRLATEIDPAFALAYSNRLFHLSHMEAVDAKTLFSEHLRFAKQFEAPLVAMWPHHQNRKDPDRQLRVGFVSGDLRNHPVASYLEPVLAHLSESAQLSLYAYHNHAHEDNVTDRLKQYLPHWRSIVELSDEAVAQKVVEDGIDILVDLSGHTDKNRLLVFARKPAPVQLSWIGYAGTTGLKAVDYYVADRLASPFGSLDSQFSEKLVRTPASAPFLPFKDAPSVNDSPSIRNGHLTFGSFNLVRKLNPSVIALWSQVLRAVPDAKMLLGGMHSTAEIDILADRFSSEGIARDRLTFHSKCAMPDYLRLHHQVDICLDTFPYPAATTSCHALWMGVPTITLAGETPVSRVGAALQKHAGLDQFVSASTADYVAAAMYWSRNFVELATIRQELRVRLSQSAMSQSDTIASVFVMALRLMWQRWCNGLPAESFEVPRSI
jgi:predicted O-linked N-acetylglucosamine transferase (SPINDLY family)